MHEQQLTELVEPILAHHGLELDELEVKPMGKRALLRITVDGDGPEGRGPLLDDISAAASMVSAALDTTDAVGSSPFTLEVSSRGISKPLTSPKHFRRNTGRLVSVKSGTTEVTGRILSATDDEVLLDVKGQQMSRNFSDITKAVVQVEMNPPKTDNDTTDVDDIDDTDEEA
ncbi:MAG: ribosome maturation factor RimP [Propionibacteriaceae bacterium]|nr:ribosome maturation factor RimP [Propionibacteriaceae bacterium]